ncbi:unnamed protein product [Schistosoma curassoni]|uniref:Acidic leucine-rich nuclear phosphoprotein 32 family member E-like n=1 Tax=Schistosoma curassoni TaxID=6186 RepID=A0A183JSN7_9TREM|nr:unnamed protein product [Schistosoma curassoni]
MDEQEETWYMDDYEEELLEEIDEEDGDNDLSGNYLDNLETIEGDDDYEDVLFENALSIKSISSEILSCTTPVLKQAYWLLILILVSCLLWRIVQFVLNKCFPSNGMCDLYIYL